MNHSIQFTKMQSAGNDYIFIDATRREVELNLSLLSKQISDRHFGIGSDGLVIIMPSEKADIGLRMFNSDGSEAEMCGNGSRCAALFARQRGLIDKDDFTIETLSGVKSVKINRSSEKSASVTVNMGCPAFESLNLPQSRDDNESLKVILTADDKAFTVIPVSIGNPHGVIFTDDLSNESVGHYGPLLERNPRWPEKANIEFASLEGPGKYKMRVWERGSGETMACGSGAVATAAAAWRLGCEKDEIEISTKGGIMYARRNKDGEILISGSAEFIADGIFYYQED